MSNKMEPNEVKDYIIKHFRPSAIVFSSPTAKQLCEENNLTPAELLRPFAGIRIKKGSANPDKPSILREFYTNFFDDTEYEITPLSTQADMRKILLERHKPPKVNEEMEDEKMLREMKPSWLDTWKAAFLELNQLQMFEMLQQPLGAFYVLTNQDRIIESLKAMYIIIIR